MSNLTPKPRKVIDWESVETQYRIGLRSLKDIGLEFDVSDAAIIKRARRDGWVRGKAPAKPQPVVLRPEEVDRSGFVYVIYVIDSVGKRYCKIGMAATFGDRLQSHRCSSPFEVFVACAYFVACMRAEERELHSIYDAKRVRGEWFILSDEDIREIASRSALI